MTPHIVKSITDPLTGETTVTQPEVVKQVISQESAKKTGEYLEQVVSDLKIGSGRHAYIDGYRVAGKTGTAVKVINGKYDYKRQVLSFIGYAPVDDPKIAMLVLIDEPQDSDLGGGTAAAPIFKKIMNQTLQYLGVPKKFDNKTTSDNANNGIKAPDLKGLSVQEAKNKLAGLGINYATLGKGTKIVSQFPKAGAVLKTGQHMYLLSEEGDKVNIPSLKGQSLRDAMELLSAIGVEVNIEGEGYVVSQTLTKENGKRRIDLVLEPLNKEDEESGQDEQNDEAAHEENAGESSGSSP